MLLGFVSLYLVHAVLRNRLGETAGWGTVLACSRSSAPASTSAA